MKIHYYLGNPAERASMGAHAAAMVRAHFSDEVVCDMWRRLLVEAGAARPRAKERTVR